VLDPASAAVSSWIPLTHSGVGNAYALSEPRTVRDAFDHGGGGGVHRWFLYWLLFNKTVRVVLSAARLSPLLQLLLTLCVYFVIPDTGGYLRAEAPGWTGGGGAGDTQEQHVTTMAEDPSTPDALRWVVRAAVEPALRAGPDTSPLSQLNLSSCVPVTTQLISLIHSEMLKLS